MTTISTCHRYDDEVEANFPFLGIILGRREIASDGYLYLNWAERECQVIAAVRAGLSVGQGLTPAGAFYVLPTSAHAQLLIVYRTVWKTPEKRALFYSR